MRFGRFVLGALLAVAVLGLLVYLLGNTRMMVQGSSPSDGSLTLKTQLPLAECRKEFTVRFPFVKLECVPRETVP